MNDNTKKILFLVAVALLIAQLTLAIIKNEWGWSEILNIAVPVMLMVSFYIQIRQDSKKTKQ